jgi:serine/threonine-protein kinase
MGAVYEVVHVETERRRALKVMLPDLLGSAPLSDRFRHEARVTANVQSEFLVDVFDAGVDAATGMPFLVMELLIGEELGRRVQRLGPLPATEVVAHLTQVASALDKTHARSIVHRDLKPANLFVAPREDGTSRVKILDFGISKIVSEATIQGVTQRGAGTPAYMAPEQLLGEPVSAATDIHALGLIAYTLLVGRPYWQDDVESVDNVFAFALRAESGPKERASTRAARHGERLPAEFDAWFERATHRDQTSRFASASQAAAALGGALGVDASALALAPLSGSAEVVPPFSAPPRAEPTQPRSRRSLWVGGGLIAAALTGIAALGRRPPPNPPVAANVQPAGSHARVGAASAVAPEPPAQHAPKEVTAPVVVASAVALKPRAALDAGRTGARSAPSRTAAKARVRPALSASATAPSATAVISAAKPRRYTRD